MIYVYSAHSCYNCGSGGAVGVFDHPPTEADMERVRVSAGGGSCLRERVACVIAEDFAATGSEGHRGAVAKTEDA